MLKNRTAALSLLLALIMLLTCLLAGCGGKTETDVTTTNAGTTEADGVTAAPIPADDETTTKAPALLPDAVNLEKIGTAKSISTTSDYGIIYKEDGKYGVRTFDDAGDSGAIYERISSEKQYFSCWTKMPTDENDLDGINASGLIDAAGKELIPAKYAAFRVLSSRFVQVIEVTGRTDTKDEALFYLTESSFSLSPSEEDALYTGNWYIYDLTAGAPVPNVSGTQAYYQYAYGTILKLTDDEGHSYYTDANGEKLERNASYFDNGYYIDNDNKGTVYTPDGKEAFSYDVAGMVPNSYSGGYYFCRKNVNGKSTYAVMDETGKVITPEFDDYNIRIAGNLIFAENKLRTFDGTPVVDREYNSMDCSTVRYLGVFLTGEDDDDRAFVDMNGNMIFEARTAEDELYFDAYDNVVRKTEGDDYVFYCWQSKEFTFKGGFSDAEGLVECYDDASRSYTLYDTVTGKTVLKGYKDYRIIANEDIGVIICAENADYSYEIYKLV